MSDARIQALHKATVAGLSLVIVYILAFSWQLEKPFWAGFTIFTVSLPSLGQSLQKAVFRTAGTVLGAASGLLLCMRFPEDRVILLCALSAYICVMAYCMQKESKRGYTFFVAAVVGTLVVLTFASEPERTFSTALSRTQETLLGIGVYTTCSLLFAPRLQLKTLHREVTALLAAHADLAEASLVPPEQPPAAKTAQTHESWMQRVYVLYATAVENNKAVDTLLPAIKLESYLFYTRRRAWDRLILLSKVLADAQREWAGTLMALDEARGRGVFPTLLHDVGLLADQYHGLREGVPASQQEAVLAVDPEVFATCSPMERSLVRAAQALYGKQYQLSHELTGFAAYGLDEGSGVPEPAREARVSLHPQPVLDPEAVSVAMRVLVFFWIAVVVWVVFDPPNMPSLRFMELTVVLALVSLLVGNANPWRTASYFVYGSLWAGMLYLFVYPLITNCIVFLLLLFGMGFWVAYKFADRKHAFAKLALVLPWLALCDFSNTPTYSVVDYANSVCALLFGVFLLALVQYLLFHGKAVTAFLHGQRCFLNTMNTVLTIHIRYWGRERPYWMRLVAGMAAHRMLFLAERLAVLAAACPVGVIAPENARVLGVEARDMAGRVQHLTQLMQTHADWLRLQETDQTAHSQPAPALLLSVGWQAGARNLQSLFSMTAASPLEEALTTIDSLEHALRALLAALSQHAACLADAPSGSASSVQDEGSLLCGTLLKGLHSYTSIIRFVPWSATGEASASGEHTSGEATHDAA